MLAVSIAGLLLSLLPVALILWLLWWSDRPPTLLLVLCLGLAGCSPTAQQTQAVTAHAIAKATNAATPLLIEAYDLEGRAVITAALTRDEAEERLDGLRDRWRPIWEAHAVFVAIHGAWATGIEAGTVTPAVAAEVREAYCALRSIAAPRLELPDFPLAACEVRHD